MIPTAITGRSSYRIVYSLTHRSSRPVIRCSSNSIRVGYVDRNAMMFARPRMRSRPCGHSSTASSA
jgi:hypothetical protein